MFSRNHMVLLFCGKAYIKFMWDIFLINFPENFSKFFGISAVFSKKKFNVLTFTIRYKIQN